MTNTLTDPFTKLIVTLVEDYTRSLDEIAADIEACGVKVLHILKWTRMIILETPTDQVVSAIAKVSAIADVHQVVKDQPIYAI